MGGSGGVIVMDDTHCVVQAAYRLLQFYAHESCGKCTPCRVGGDWAVRTYERILANEGSQVELDNLAPRVGRAAERPLPVRPWRLGGLGHRLDVPPLLQRVRGPRLRHECNVGPTARSAARTGLQGA